MQQVLNMVHKEIRGLHQAAYILALFTFGSQILALIRDRLLAHEFGASIELDLYYTAFRIPDFLYVLFASTLSVYVLIPFISERIKGEDYTKARELLSQIFTLFIAGYVLIASIAIVFAEPLVQFLFPGFEAYIDTLVLLVRVLLLQPLLLGISSLFGVVTQLKHRFILYAVGPIIYNIGIILGLIFLYPIMGIIGLAYGVVLGALGHLCIQLPFVMGTKLAPRVTRRIDMSEIGKVLGTSLTRALTLSLHQVILLALIGFASIMTVGSVSVFQFAFNLQSVPLAIIGVSYSVAAFPFLAQLFAEHKHEEFSASVSNALKHIFFWSLPVIALFIVIRAQFVRVVLGSGEFDWDDTRLTAAVLALFVISLTAQAVHLLMTRALYAVGNTRIPLLVTLFSSSLTLLTTFFFYMHFVVGSEFSQTLIGIMRLEGVPGTEVLALSLGYTSAMLVHGVTILLVGHRKIYLSLKTLVRPLIQSFVAALGAGFVSYVALQYFVTIYTNETLLGVFLQGFIAGAVGLVGYILMQALFRSRELSEVVQVCRKRLIRKEEMLAPQDEDHLAI